MEDVPSVVETPRQVRENEEGTWSKENEGDQSLSAKGLGHFSCDLLFPHHHT